MYEYSAKMIKVIDGDTMDFEVDLGFKIKHTIRIRLRDIDTPELFRPRNAAEKNHARNAAKFVYENFLGRVGRLTTHKDKTGKYGRYLADFSLPVDFSGRRPVLDAQWKSLSDELLSHGFEKRESYGE